MGSPYSCSETLGAMKVKTFVEYTIILLSGSHWGSGSVVVKALRFKSVGAGIDSKR